MGKAFSTQFHLEWRKMTVSNEYIFRDHFIPLFSPLHIIPIRFAFITPSSMNYQNDYESFPIIRDLYLQLLCGICRNAKGKFNISVDYLTSNRELEMTPISSDVPSNSTRIDTHTQFLSGKCYASSKIIYPSRYAVNMPFWFSSRVVHLHYINLFYESRYFFLYFPEGSDQQQQVSPSEMKKTFSPFKIRLYESKLERFYASLVSDKRHEKSFTNDHHIVSQFLTCCSTSCGFNRL